MLWTNLALLALGVLSAVLWRMVLRKRNEAALLSKQLKQVRNENEILRKQRDNDVHTVDDADSVWDKILNDKYLPEADSTLTGGTQSNEGADT